MAAEEPSSAYQMASQRSLWHFNTSESRRKMSRAACCPAGRHLQVPVLLRCAAGNSPLSLDLRGAISKTLTATSKIYHSYLEKYSLSLQLCPDPCHARWMQARQSDAASAPRSPTPAGCRPGHQTAKQQGSCMNQGLALGRTLSMAMV